jgi:hypothetical protein
MCARFNQRHTKVADSCANALWLTTAPSTRLATAEQRVTKSVYCSASTAVKMCEKSLSKKRASCHQTAETHLKHVHAAGGRRSSCLAQITGKFGSSKSDARLTGVTGRQIS